MAVDAPLDGINQIILHKVEFWS